MDKRKGKSGGLKIIAIGSIIAVIAAIVGLSALKLSNSQIGPFNSSIEINIMANSTGIYASGILHFSDNGAALSIPVKSPFASDIFIAGLYPNTEYAVNLTVNRTTIECIRAPCVQPSPAQVAELVTTGPNNSITKLNFSLPG